MIGYLIKLEWLKFKKNRAVRNSLLIYTLLLPGAFFMGRQIEITTDGFGFMGKVFDFPLIWSSIGYAGNWLVFIFLGYVATVMTTSEFDYRTLRQNVIDGMRRKDIFFAKSLSILAISVYATIAYVICVVLFGAIYSDNVDLEAITSDLQFIPLYFLMCFGYMVFAFFISVLIRRTGPSIIAYLAYTFFLEPALRWGIHKEAYDHKSMHFYPMNAVEDLMPLPVKKQAKLFIQQNDYDYFLTTPEAVITTLIFSSIFLFLVYRRLKSTDL